VGLPESPARRAASIARVGARYGFGFVFGSRFLPRRRAEPGRVGTRLRLSLQELGPTFGELGRFLSVRRDLIPPDVAVELGRATVAVKPITPAEVRALVERELNNRLERLFLLFEETPVRVGPFTQSHRVVLPGERPALVVVNRPVVRRDLLAMRPVADLTRRRLGDRLPLDPTETVAEFAAHANHRRDMYFAAQICRRLKGIENLQLRVPDVFRGYSTARCLTFEAPVDPAPLGETHYRLVAEALVRLALGEGIYLADPTPERFILNGPTGEVWLADPTEVFALDPERLRGAAEVLAAVRRGDVDGIVRALPLAGGSVPREDSVLRRELRETVGALGGPLWREHSLEEVRDRGLEAARRGFLSPILVGPRARIGANAVVTKDVPEGATMVGIPARQTLVDAEDYSRPFVPYGTPCNEAYDPSAQKLEALKCEVEQLRKRLAELIEERDGRARGNQKRDSA